MKLTVVGCAGSFAGPDSPASCYLVEAPFQGGTYRLVLDLGSGALGDLQRYCDLRDIDAIALSHLHADHCFDLSGMYVVSKYHPDGALPQIPVLAPAGAGEHLAMAYGIEEPPGMTEQFDFQDCGDGGTVQLGPFTENTRLVDNT
ncbi:MAG: fold metallo-hydrolase [Aeromicrobium sp.]|nr:fold metallo-hydrolase [Aeromicrobium sp.]